MRIDYLQHVPFENLGSMHRALLDAGHTVRATHLYNSEPLPASDQFDFLIVMGGPMGVHDEAEYPWLGDEKRFIRNAIEEDKIVLGVCLGAQLIADVLGASVYPNPHKEIGWFEIKRTEASAESAIGQAFPESVEAFHWHGDTFDLPLGAIHLARSTACENQAFVYHQRVLALQFHLETTRESAEALIQHCSAEIDHSEFTQSTQHMLSNDKRFTTINNVMLTLIEQLTSANA